MSKEVQELWVTRDGGKHCSFEMLRGKEEPKPNESGDFFPGDRAVCATFSLSTIALFCPFAADIEPGTALRIRRILTPTSILYEKV